MYTSAVGYSLTYNTLDNNKNPTMGMLATSNQDFAGVGGDVNYIKTTTDLRSYREIVPDVVGILHLQGGYVTGWGGKDVRMLDHFQMGPSLVRGFAPSGIGARTLSQLAYTGSYGDALGGTMYWGASVEFQTPLYFLPKDSGVRVAAFADAGSLWNYVGPTSRSVTGERINGNPDCAKWGPNVANPIFMLDRERHDRALVGGRRPDLGLAVRSASVRLLVPDHQSALRPGAAIPVRRWNIVLAPPLSASATRDRSGTVGRLRMKGMRAVSFGVALLTVVGLPCRPGLNRVACRLASHRARNLPARSAFRRGVALGSQSGRRYHSCEEWKQFMRKRPSFMWSKTKMDFGSVREFKDLRASERLLASADIGYFDDDRDHRVSRKDGTTITAPSRK